jgi:hypothetical protein
MLMPMTRWFALQSADAGFLDSAPYVFRYQQRFAAPPQTVWDSIASDDSLAAWGPTVSSITWTTPRPFGVGTTREVALAPGVIRVRERFFRWDEGHGYSFGAYEANAPLFRRFAEDYRIEAAVDDPNTTIFTWTVALEPSRTLALPFRAIAPVLKVAFGRTVTDGRKYFARTGSRS